MSRLFRVFDRSKPSAHRQPKRPGRMARLETLEPRMMLSWTVLNYIDGDNNLESYGVLNVNQMEKVGSTSNVKFVAQFDRSPGYDSTNGNWTDTRRALIVKDTNTKTMTSFQGSGQSIGEADMGDPNTLASFIQWGVATYPADHYLLDIWDHGGGLDGACWDDSNGSDYLTVKEIESGIAAGTTAMPPGKHFDIVGFDACMMGMEEVRHQLVGLADVVVASEQTIPGNGWPYDKIASDLVANPAMTASQLGTKIVQRYGQVYGAMDTLSATNMATESKLTTDLNNFAVAAERSAEWTTITNARNASAYYTDTTFRDLGTFLSYVGSHAADPGLRSAAQTASTDYQASIIKNYSGRREHATGLSIYLPGQGPAIRSDYTAANFDFAADTQWDEFLVRYTTNAPPLPKASTSTSQATLGAVDQVHLGALFASQDDADVRLGASFHRLRGTDPVDAVFINAQGTWVYRV